MEPRELEMGTKRKRDRESEGCKEKGQFIFNGDSGAFTFKAD